MRLSNLILAAFLLAAVSTLSVSWPPMANAASPDDPVAAPISGEKEAESGLSDECKAALPTGDKAKPDDIQIFMSIGDACDRPWNKSDQDAAQALKWYKKAAELGYDLAQYHICMIGGSQPAPIAAGEAFKWCLEAAKQTDGDAGAARVVAWRYENGEGTGKDLVQAYLWSAVAAKYDPNGLVRNNCIRDFKKLSDQLTPDQLAEAQRLFLDWRPQKKLVGKFGGIGIGLAQAQGAFYVSTVLVGSPAKFAGLKPDDTILEVDGVTVENMTLDALSEKIRGPRGTRVEIIVSRSGKSGPVQQQFKIVREDLSSVAPFAHNDFQMYFDMNMGVMYSNGCGVKQDYSEAAKWFLESAMADYPEAQVALAELYETGKGVTQDWVEAYFWYSVAAEYDYRAREKRISAAKRLSPWQIIRENKRAAAWRAPTSGDGKEVIQVIRGPQ